MEKEFYLVSYVGIYKDNEGDHTHQLFDNLKDASNAFAKNVEDCKSFYQDTECQMYENTTYFSLRTEDETDSVDIYLMVIKPNGEIHPYIF